jgi:hypothetical protein
VTTQPESAENDSIQLGMFDNQANMPNSRANVTLWLLTNRNNLLDVLSSGWIKPKQGYKKYYADLGDYCPSGIPFLLQLPPADLVNSLSEETTNFPVLLKVQFPNQSQNAISREGWWQSSSEKFIFLRENEACCIFYGVIPTSHVVEILFRNHHELFEEFMVRDYENVPSIYQSLCKVSAEHFAGSELNTAQLKEALVKIEKLHAYDNGSLINAFEAIGGALLFTCGTAQHMPQEHWSLLYPLVHNLVEVPKNESFRGFTSHHLLWLLAPFSSLESAADPEELLFRQIINELIRLTPQSYYNVDFVISVRHQFMMTEFKDSSDIGTALQSVIDVLLGDLDRAEFPYSISVVTNALLLFTLHSDPKAASNWLTNQVLTPDIILLASAFVGTLCGYSLVPTSLRPDHSTAQYIANVLAGHLNGIISNEISVFKNVSGAFYNAPIPQFLSEVLSGTTTIDEAPTGKGHMQDENIDQQNYELLVNSDFTKREDLNAVMYLCQHAKWDDCVTTVIRLGKRRFVLTNTGADGDIVEPSLRLMGFPPTPIFEIKRERLKKRLTPEFWFALDPKIKRQVNALLTGEIFDETTVYSKSKPRKRSAPKKNSL